MTETTEPQLALTRVVHAPRPTVFRAFTDGDQFCAWWGPIGNSILRDQSEFDVRTGGFLSWTELFPGEPDLKVWGRIDFSEVIENELFDGLMRVTGNLPGQNEPFESRMRIEFYDEADGRTRLEIRQWLPDEVVAPSVNGWGESLSKLDTLMAALS